MNCGNARDIMDLVLNGEDHPLAAEAREHVRHCEACGEWESGMSRVLDMMAGLSEPPEVDISAAVVSKLPAAHPASLAQRPILRVLTLVTASWVICVAAAMLTVVALRWIDASWLTPVFSFSRMAAGVIGPVLGFGKVLLMALESSTGALTGWASSLLWFLGIDMAVLCAAAFAWRRRSIPTNVCLM